MAKLKISNDQKGSTSAGVSVRDVSPGRSIYLSNSQWAALNECLGNEVIWNDMDQAGAPESLRSALSKLLKVANEVQAKNDKNKEDN